MSRHFYTNRLYFINRQNIFKDGLFTLYKWNYLGDDGPKITDAINKLFVV